jgi:hypothetical protein
MNGALRTYTYVIEVSGDGETWRPERDDATGTEETAETAYQFAHTVLENRLNDKELLSDPGEHVRVVVWKGDHAGTLSMSAAVAYPA